MHDFYQWLIRLPPEILLGVPAFVLFAPWLVRAVLQWRVRSRLYRCHKKEWRDVSRPNIAFGLGFARTTHLMRFIESNRHEKMGDKKLSRWIRLERALWLAQMLGVAVVLLSAMALEQCYGG